jgi:3-oxoacyl-ACP reductase-like protein
MMRKIYNLLAGAALAVVLALAGLVAWLAVSGKLSAQRIEQVAALLRGQSTAAEPASAPQSQPASQPAAVSLDAAHDARIRSQLQKAALDRAARDVEARRELLTHVLQDVISRQEKLDSDRSAWIAQKNKLSKDVKDKGFQREVEYVTRLSPEQAKEHVVRVWQKQKADAVRLFNALEPGKGQKILEEFTTPTELQIVHELLEQLRIQDVDEFVSGTGTPRDDKTP